MEKILIKKNLNITSYPRPKTKNIYNFLLKVFKFWIVNGSLLWVFIASMSSYDYFV